MKDILFDLNICCILEYYNDHAHYIGIYKCKDLIVDKIKGDKVIKKIFDDSIYDYVRDFRNGCTADIEKWEKHYKEDYYSLFRNSFAKQIFPYVYANVYKKEKIDTDVVRGMNLFINPFNVLHYISIDNNGNMMYKNIDIKEYLNETLKMNYITKKGYYEYEEIWYWQRGLRWRKH